MLETRTHRLIRYGIVAAIVLVIGGLFVQREFLADDETTVVATDGSGEALSIGLLDDRDVEIGEPVPDFRLDTLSHGVIDLSDFRGQTVVLNFWASWCGPCREEMPEFAALYRERADAGDLTVIAVDFTPDDTRAAAAAFVEEYELPFPIALDTAGGDVASRFGVHGLPSTFFIDADGVLRSRMLGPVFGDLLPDNVEKADHPGGASAD